MTDPSATSHPSPHGLVHEAVVYRSTDELTAALDAFVGDAALAEEPVLLALPAEHLAQIPPPAAETTRLDRHDMREVGRNPQRLLPFMQNWIAARARDGGAAGRVRIVSEAVWPGRSYPERAEGLRHEALVNEVLAEAPVTMLCPFDAAHLDPETLAGVELTHPAIVEGDRLRPSLAYPGLAGMDLDAIWPLEPPASPIHEHDLGTTLGDLRHAVAGDPLLATLSRDRRSDLVMAVNEATTNAVQHGDGGCSARIWHDGRSLVTEIASDGAVENPLAARAPRPDPGAGRGRGLWLINQVCDLVEMRSGDAGTTLRLHMHDAAL